MDAQIQSLMKSFDAIKKVSPNGADFWMARDLQVVLAYTKWDNFESVINKAKMACESSGLDSNDHILETGKLIDSGKGAQLERKDYFLSRYGCYLVAMNGDPSKAEIGIAQTYFAVQARRQEIHDEQSQLSKRMELRNRVTVANKALNSAAQAAGVQNYAFFHEAGYRGLYGMGLSEIKQRKKISGDLLDHAGRAELAANEFRITQAEQKIVRDGVKGEQNAIKTHNDVGAEVRATIKKIGGTMPEDLPPEPSLKQLTSKKKSALQKNSDIK